MLYKKKEVPREEGRGHKEEGKFIHKRASKQGRNPFKNMRRGQKKEGEERVTFRGREGWRENRLRRAENREGRSTR